MNTQSYETILEQFQGVHGSIDLLIDGVQFFYVDVDRDFLEGYAHVTASCGCCGDTEYRETELSYELQYMDELDFRDLLEQLEKLKERST
jgi:hypothetical protein